LNHLQRIQNFLARAVVAAPRSSNPDHILKSLHWLKVPERIAYKIISTTYKLLQSYTPHYLRDLITIQSSRSTRSSSSVTLLLTPVQPSLKITNLCFQSATLHLWKSLSTILRVASHSVSSRISSSSVGSDSYFQPAIDLLMILVSRLIFFKIFSSVAFSLFYRLIPQIFDMKVL